MKHRIAILADVHGNATALQAVIEDSREQAATEYWFLGDLLLPGPGAANVCHMLEALKPSVVVRGNWDDCFLEVLDGDVDLENPTDVFFAKLVEHLLPQLEVSFIERIRSWPLHQMAERNGIKIGISHNLPEVNDGGALRMSAEQAQFDKLFDCGDELDLAVYAHVHHQTMRYSSRDQLILNPGSVGQPYNDWPKLRRDLRACYLILEIDEAGIVDVDFRKVDYDAQAEFEVARETELPYLELYKIKLMTGKTFTHDGARLSVVSEAEGYAEDVRAMLDRFSRGKL